MAIGFACVLWFGDVKPALRDAISKVLPRRDDAILFEDSGPGHAIYMAGAFEDPEASVRAGGGRITICNGDPVFNEEVFQASSGRGEEIDHLHAQCLDRPGETLSRANGSFSAVSLDLDRKRAVLAVDAVGAYPLFYILNRECLIVSSSPAIASLPLDNKTADETGLAETVIAGFNFSDHTPFSYMRRLSGGTLVDASANGGSPDRYCRLDDRAPFRGDQDTLEHILYDKFLTATRRRLRNQKAVSAFLSGGLDSRCVVGALSALGVEVHTFNRSPVGSLDEALGRGLARGLGTRHRESPTVPWSGLIWSALRDDLDARDLQADEPNMVWTGDGGGLVMGNIHIEPEMAEAGCSGRLFTEQGVTEFPEVFGIVEPYGYLRPELTGRWFSLIKQSALGELNRLNTGDGSRAAFLWFLMNQERNVLNQHFSTAHEHGLNIVSPFYDADFMRTIVSAPIDWFFAHRLYNSWLHKFPPAVAATPWQSYPGHEPCPLPLPEAQSQFELVPSKMRHVRRRRNILARQCLVSDTGGRVKRRTLFYHLALQVLQRKSRDWVWLPTSRIVEVQKSLKS